MFGDGQIVTISYIQDNYGAPHTSYFYYSQLTHVLRAQIGNSGIFPQPIKLHQENFTKPFFLYY